MSTHSTQSTHTTATRVTAIALAGPTPCDGRLLDVPAGQYDWLRLLVTTDGAEQQDELDEEVWLHYRGGADPEWLRTTGTGADGRRTARIPVTRRDDLLAVRLPVRAGITVHAADLTADTAPSAPTTDFPIGA
ncbi:hypothetical protein OG444_14335 [Streptomyces sp. NBC_01232]|uniref:hypothetical protein n=1 Tax=unclassified Streptomyces TaxID=2593676 RepID=UPI002E0ED129|nr:hypothetical protein OG444_14335 [Streptomyces sp. NBC_01232]